MRRVILSGGPGAGKTTLISELARRGYSTVSESARELIAERLSRGDTPRPEPTSFAQELLRRDKIKYAEVPAQDSFIFFDRSPIESLAMVHEAAPLAEAQLQAELTASSSTAQCSCFHPGGTSTKPTPNATTLSTMQRGYTPAWFGGTRAVASPSTKCRDSQFKQEQNMSFTRSSATPNPSFNPRPATASVVRPGHACLRSRG
jgi:predicted ATPase